MISLIFTWSSKKGGEVYLVVGGHPVDLRCRPPQLHATWPVFPLMDRISRPVHDRDGHDLIFNGVGPRRSEVQTDNLRGPRLEITRHHTVEPAAKHRILSERARKKLDLVGRSGYTHACHKPFLSLVGDLAVSCPDSITAPDRPFVAPATRRSFNLVEHMLYGRVRSGLSAFSISPFVTPWHQITFC